MKKEIIPTYVINLKSRIDRKKHILRMFSGKPEFDVYVVEAIEHPVGAIGLWHTIREIVRQAKKAGMREILICEDDHFFTSIYSREKLFTALAEAKEREADVLCGGVSWFLDALPVSNHLYWTNQFSGTQFIIVFEHLFDKILSAEFGELDTADAKICSFTNKIFFICPFISVQKDFGYSDVTSVNDGTNRVEDLFARAIGRLEILKRIKVHYQQLYVNAEMELDYNAISIPTYVINLPERVERLEHIKQQFEGKPEFDVTIVEASKHQIGAVGLWLSIRRIIQLAIDNDDDVIIICEDDHEFTPEYSRDYLLKNIFEAHQQGVDYLSGGLCAVNNVVPIASNRYWISFCQASQFIILYKSFFQQILDKPFDDSIIADLCFSEMTVNKMVLHPGISVQKDFGYSDVTPFHNENQGFVQMMFKEVTKRLAALESSRNAYLVR